MEVERRAAVASVPGRPAGKDSPGVQQKEGRDVLSEETGWKVNNEYSTVTTDVMLMSHNCK